MKTCTKCGVSKDETEFYNDSGKKGGLKHECKPCTINATTAYRQAHLEKYRKYQYDINRNNIKHIYGSRYDKMSRRVNGYYPRYHSSNGKELLSRQEFDQWCKDNQSAFDKIYEAWKKSGFVRNLTPTIDRIDNTIGYIASNMQWLTLIDNTIKGAKSGK